MLAAHPLKTEQTISDPSPATKPSWRFGDLSAAELLPVLQQYLIAQDTEANWQLVWLNNDGRPVIGLLPRVSWSVYDCAEKTSNSNEQAALYQVTKTCRDAVHNDITITYMSYSDWQDELISYSQMYDGAANSRLLAKKTDKASNYHHGLIGFIGYDIAAYELSPAAKIERAAQPCAVLGHYDIYLTPEENHGNAGWKLTINATVNDSENDFDDQQKNKMITALVSYLDIAEKKLADDCLNKSQLTTSPLPAPLVLKSRWRKQDYQQAFNQTQNYLQQGDCYQINLTQEWQGFFDHNPSDNGTLPMLIDYLPALHRNTQAPFAGYLAVNHFNHEIKDNTSQHPFELLSCSPELFFTFTKDIDTGKHHIITKPIKGTMPRSTNIQQDNAYKQQLTNSEKDRAENVMIVDLLRNDLGKYAKIGSVKVPKLFAIESFSNVHHMVSTITAELQTNTHPLAVLFGSLPAGSITGTPKKRAVEIISELETAPRGAYCGTLGYMNFDGTGQWNVLIRTLQANTMPNNELDKKRHISLWAGGGITVASDCDAEYQECLDKVGNLLSVLTQDNINKYT
ncbi:anthranilate synthase component I family protein [Psychrobacter aquimaris]|uniref:anthranilate synthase component I family protein n=1 Tax=Psychrobacter aquimaris TaxID=292733 RepID=UPI0018E00B1A|nr:anthranilate synthase component I family protein [Psychrobacter aquimaris]